MIASVKKSLDPEQASFANASDTAHDILGKLLIVAATVFGARSFNSSRRISQSKEASRKERN
ncbi:hypothetical protein Pan216_28760 [Planctomycetes bacterium Pan216]|uniref:Uncharacterized protein n=1 Tax=Kolteria novifilia TaxID=2527975 RepID=A0A518B4V6_9BACT|nr:hypothetical protein Pan216_28760 [Planctomycetes bacterium Pan216]